MKNSPVEKFISLYEKERIKVDKKLSKILSGKKPASLYEPASYIIESKGKRLRPLLVILSAKAAGGKNVNLKNAAVAVELLHNFTLVHDDIMDNADKRRGKPTLHKKYDLNTAILAGDVLLAVAYEYLLKDCNGNAKQVLASFTKGLVEVCEGQSLDKEFETTENVSINDYISMIEKKTAAMAKMCCEIGALLGGGRKKEISALAGFGKNIGIAFQIQDDLLDIMALESEFGKVIGGDLIEGKKTFLFIKALEKSEGQNEEMLLDVLKNKGITAERIHDFKNLYQRLGVIDDAKMEIVKYTTKALSSLKTLKRAEDRAMFRWLADSLINRTK